MNHNRPTRVFFFPCQNNGLALRMTIGGFGAGWNLWTHWLDCHVILYKHTWSPEDTSNWLSWAPDSSCSTPKMISSLHQWEFSTATRWLGTNCCTDICGCDWWMAHCVIWAKPPCFPSDESSTTKQVKSFKHTSTSATSDSTEVPQRVIPNDRAAPWLFLLCHHRLVFAVQS